MLGKGNILNTTSAIEIFKEDAIQRLNDSGTLQSTSGSFQGGRFTLSFFSCVGDKNKNEDAAFLWTSNEGPLLWAAAIADGVTGSMISKAASELACLAAIATVVSSGQRGL